MTKPKMSIWKFGAIRHVVLMDDLTVLSNEFSYNNYIMTAPEIQKLKENDSCIIIGMFNDAIPILFFDKIVPPRVYIYEQILPNPLIPIATSYASLRAILDKIASVWNPISDQLTIAVTDENIIAAKAILNEIEKANPHIDLSFWEVEGFSGLNFGFDLK